MKEKHERFGAVTGCDIVELDPIGCDIPMTTKLLVQQTIWRNCTNLRKKREKKTPIGSVEKKT